MANRLQSLLSAAFISAGPFKTFLEEVAAVAGGSVSSSGPISLIWVAPNGNNVTGQRGRIDLPFATIAAALGAALTGDTILVAPGTYAPVDFGDFPPALLAVSIVGVGAADMIVLETATGPALFWQPGPAAKRLSLQNLTFRTFDAAEEAVALIGPGSGNPNTSSAELVRCKMETPLLPGLRAVNLARVELVESSGAFQVENCNAGRCQDHIVQVGAAESSVGITVPTPGHVAPQDFLVQGGRFGMPLRAVGNGRLRSDAAADVDVIGLGLSSGNPCGPEAVLFFQGQAGGAEIYPVTGAEAILTGSRITNMDCNWPDAANPFTISARGATIARADLVSSGGDFILDTRGGFLSPGESSFGANCFWDRYGGGSVDLPLVAGINNPVFGTDFPEPPFPPGTDVSYVTTPQTLGVTATDQVAVTAASNLGCEISSGYVGVIACNVIWHRQG